LIFGGAEGSERLETEGQRDRGTKRSRASNIVCQVAISHCLIVPLSQKKQRDRDNAPPFMPFSNDDTMHNFLHISIFMQKKIERNSINWKIFLIFALICATDFDFYCTYQEKIDTNLIFINQL
jgi:hypothetical protein